MILASTLITPLQVYIVIKLDAIIRCLPEIITFSSYLFFISVIALLLSNKAYFKRCLVVGGLSALLFCGSFVLKVMLPTTKEALLIYGIPALVNNDKVQEKVGNAMDGAEEMFIMAKRFVMGDGEQKQGDSKP